MLSLLSQFTEAQSDLNHFFLKIDGSEESKFELEYGKVTYDENYSPKQIVVDSIMTTDDLLEHIFFALAQDNTSPKFNILIHGIWADRKFAWNKMVQNLWYAAGYNIIAIPLAAGVLAGVGIILSPAVGAVLMSLSTVVVAINARLLKAQQLN